MKHKQLDRVPKHWATEALCGTNALSSKYYATQVFRVTCKTCLKLMKRKK